MYDQIKLYEETHEMEIFIDTIIKLYHDRRDLFDMVKRITNKRACRRFFVATPNPTPPKNRLGIGRSVATSADAIFLLFTAYKKIFIGDFMCGNVAELGLGQNKPPDNLLPPPIFFLQNAKKIASVYLDR